jgi:TonB-dependent siderophore receptor
MPAPPPPAPGPGRGARRLARAVSLAFAAAAMLAVGQAGAAQETGAAAATTVDQAGAAAAQAPGSAQPPGAAQPPAATGTGAAAPGATAPGTAAPGDSPADRDQTGAAPVLHHREELLVEGVADLVPATTTIVKLPLPTRLLPATIDVIGAPLLEQQDARVLGDALRDASGVGIHTESGAADFFVLRGLDSETSALVMTDGAPEPVTTFYQLYNADRVEVLKGPASFLYGGNPLAGVVNIVRKQPLADEFVEAAALGGSFGTRQGTLDSNWSGQDGRLGLRLNGLWEATDGWRDGRGGRAWGVNPVFAWRPQDAGTSLVVSFERLEDHFNPDAGLPLLGNQVAGVPASRSYQSPFDRSDQGLSRFQLDLEGKAGAFTVHDKAYYRELSWLSDGTLLDGVFPDPTGRLQVARSLVLLDDRQQFWGNQLEASTEAKTGPLTHHLLGGLELARRGDDFTLDVGALPSIDLLAPVETARGPVFLIPGESSAGDARTLIAAPYLLDHVAFSERLQLLLGGRFDHLDYRDRATGTVRHDSQLSPMAGVTYSPAAASGLSLYANAGRGFAPPSTRVVGPARPEAGSQLEAGAKSDLAGGRLRATLAVYQLTRRNEAIPSANGFSEQTGSQRTRGVELSLLAHRLAGFDVVFSYAYESAVFTRFAESVLVAFEPPTFATVDRTGNTPPLAPAQIANLWLSRRLPAGLELGAGGRYVSRQYIAADNAFAIPAAFTADASLALPLGPLKARLEVKNLTNARTYTRGLGTTSVIPASGAAVYAGVTMRLTAPFLARTAPARPGPS